MGGHPDDEVIREQCTTGSWVSYRKITKTLLRISLFDILPARFDSIAQHIRFNYSPGSNIPFPSCISNS